MATVDANECDFYNLELRRNGAAPLVGFTKIAVPWEIENAHVMGNRRVPLGTTEGRLKPGDGSLTVLMGAYADLVSDPQWCRAKHGLVLQYAKGGAAVVNVSLRGVKFKGGDDGAEESADPIKRELKFTFERIFINGFCPATGEAEEAVQ